MPSVRESREDMDSVIEFEEFEGPPNFDTVPSSRADISQFSGPSNATRKALFSCVLCRSNEHTMWDCAVMVQILEAANQMEELAGAFQMLLAFQEQ